MTARRTERDDEHWARLLADGVLEVDNAGVVWRKKTWSRTGRLLEIKPKRADWPGLRLREQGRVMVRGVVIETPRLVWIATRGLPGHDSLVEHINGDFHDNRPNNLRCRLNHTTTHPLYSTWRNMIARCHTPSHEAFKNYGARGIAVCQRWQESFEDFVSDVGERPEGKTLDRVNNDLGYEPGNVRWATASEQARNRRTVRKEAA